MAARAALAHAMSRRKNQRINPSPESKPKGLDGSFDWFTSKCPDSNWDIIFSGTVFKEKSRSAVEKDQRIKCFGASEEVYKTCELEAYLARAQSGEIIFVLSKPGGVQLDRVLLTDISEVVLVKTREEDVGVLGSIALRAQQKGDSQTQFHLDAYGVTLANKDAFGKSDPFLTLSICQDGGDEHGSPQSVKMAAMNMDRPDWEYRSETINNNLNPRWKQIEVDIKDPSTTSLKVQCWDEDAGGQHDLIGSFQIKMGDLMKDRHWKAFPLLGEDQRKGLHATVHSSEKNLHATVDSSEEDKMKEEDLLIYKGLSRFEVHTAEEGNHLGKKFVLYASNNAMQELWVSEISTQLEKLRDHEHLKNANHKIHRMLLGLQLVMRKGLQSKAMQSFTTAVIVLAFMSNVIEAEIRPAQGSPTARILEGFETFFVIAFSIELVWNIVANFWTPFLKDVWNYLDVIIVVLSWVSQISSGTGQGQGVGGITAIRLLRVFRVVRLLKMFGRLRLIVNALASSVIPVLSCMVLLLLATCLSAIIATDMLSEDGEAGQELFGSFSLSFFTMWQVATGDGWSDVVREFRMSDGRQSPLLAVLFGFYVFVVGLVLMNVLVAVLLDEFISTVSAEKERVATEERKQDLLLKDISDLHGPLDQLMQMLSNFTNRRELVRMIETLFQILDDENDGVITYEEVSKGWKKLNILHVDQEEWNHLISDFSNDRKELSLESFTAMMMHELKAYTQYRIVHAMNLNTKPNLREIQMGLKLLLSESSNDSGYTQGPDGGSQAIRALLEQLQISTDRVCQTLEQVQSSTDRVCQTQDKILELLDSSKRSRRVSHLDVTPLPPPLHVTLSAGRNSAS